MHSDKDEKSRSKGTRPWVALLIMAAFLAGGCPLRVGNLKEKQPSLQKETAALTHFTNAQQLALDGQGDEALKEMEAAVAADPDSPYLREMQAYLLYQMGRFDEGLKAADASIKLDDRRPSAFLVRGLILVEMERYEEAEQAFATAATLDPDEQEYAINLADAQFRQGKMEEGIATLSDFGDRHPEALLVRYYKALVLMNTGDLEAARTEYRAILEVSPSYYLALSDLMRLDLRTGRTEEAIEVGYALVEFYPYDTDGRLLLVRALHSTGQDEEALRLLEEGKSEGELDPVWWNTKGFYLIDLKRYDEARDEFDSAISIDAKNDQAVYGLGLVALETGDRAGATAYFESVPPTSPVFVQARRMLATMALQDDQPDVAIHVAQQAFMAQPQNQDAVVLASWVLRETGKLDEAAKLMDAAAKRWPDSPAIWIERALILSEQGKYDQAVELMQKFLEQHPDSPVALNFIGYLWAQQGVKLDEAETMIRQALAADPEGAYIQDSLGWVYYQRGDYDQAMEWLQKAQQNLPDDPEVLEHLGDCQKARGETKAAREAYAQALEQATNVRQRARLRTKLEETK